jgi:hypothetical protein
MDIFQNVTNLNLPKDSYVVVGGGTMVALGILGWGNDVDICVTPEVFDHYKALGWNVEEWQDISMLKHEVYDVGTRFGEWTVEDLLPDAIYIQDIPFLSLEKLLLWKQQMGRPKDLQHIKLINEYLASR